MNTFQCRLLLIRILCICICVWHSNGASRGQTGYVIERDHLRYEGNTATAPSGQTSQVETLFRGRFGHSSFYDASLGALVVIGGRSRDSNTISFNDVWKSTSNGYNWTQVDKGGSDLDTLFQVISIHTAVINGFGNYIVIGGSTGLFNSASTSVYSNEVWLSIDSGKYFAQVNTSKISATITTTAAGLYTKGHFQRRASHSSIIDSQGDLYVIGGRYSTYYMLNDVWRASYPYIKWKQVATGTLGYLPSCTVANCAFASVISGTLFTVRFGHTSLVDSNDAIYVIGGASKYNSVFYTMNEVWKSTDRGVTWRYVVTGTTPSTLFPPRHMHASAIDSNDRLYVAGGWGGTMSSYADSDSGSEFFNDLWMSSDSGGKWFAVSILFRYEHRIY